MDTGIAQGPEVIAARLGRPVEWARLHMGDHRCLDGRRYVGSCLVSDPSCDHLARARLDALAFES